MENKKEFRSFQFEVRAEESEQYGKHLEGMPIVFDAETNLGDFMEEISRGALDHTDLKDVRFLVNHNTDMIPLARSRNNNENSTMQMKVEEEGMKIRVNLDTENNADARALYSAVQRGDISGMSFMFTVDEDRWEGLDTEMPKRYITSIAKVFEVSAVSFPAYEQTSIAARSQIDALESAKKALESERLEARKADLWEIFRNNLEEVRSHGN